MADFYSNIECARDGISELMHMVKSSKTILTEDALSMASFIGVVRLYLEWTEDHHSLEVKELSDEIKKISKELFDLYAKERGCK